MTEEPGLEENDGSRDDGGNGDDIAGDVIIAVSIIDAAVKVALVCDGDAGDAGDAVCIVCGRIVFLVFMRKHVAWVFTSLNLGSSRRSNAFRSRAAALVLSTFALRTPCACRAA